MFVFHHALNKVVILSTLMNKSYFSIVSMLLGCVKTTKNYCNKQKDVYRNGESGSVNPLDGDPGINVQVDEENTEAILKDMIMKNLKEFDDIMESSKDKKFNDETEYKISINYSLLGSKTEESTGDSEILISPVYSQSEAIKSNDLIKEFTHTKESPTHTKESATHTKESTDNNIQIVRYKDNHFTGLTKIKNIPEDVNSIPLDQAEESKSSIIGKSELNSDDAKYKLADKITYPKLEESSIVKDSLLVKDVNESFSLVSDTTINEGYLESNNSTPYMELYRSSTLSDGSDPEIIYKRQQLRKRKKDLEKKGFKIVTPVYFYDFGNGEFKEPVKQYPSDFNEEMLHDLYPGLYNEPEILDSDSKVESYDLQDTKNYLEIAYGISPFSTESSGIESHKYYEIDKPNCVNTAEQNLTIETIADGESKRLPDIGTIKFKEDLSCQEGLPITKLQSSVDDQKYFSKSLIQHERASSAFIPYDRIKQNKLVKASGLGTDILQEKSDHPNRFERSKKIIINETALESYFDNEFTGTTPEQSYHDSKKSLLIDNIHTDTSESSDFLNNRFSLFNKRLDDKKTSDKKSEKLILKNKMPGDIEKFADDTQQAQEISDIQDNFNVEISTAEGPYRNQTRKKRWTDQRNTLEFNYYKDRQKTNINNTNRKIPKKRHLDTTSVYPFSTDDDTKYTDISSEISDSSVYKNALLKEDDHSSVENIGDRNYNKNTSKPQHPGNIQRINFIFSSRKKDNKTERSLSYTGMPIISFKKLKKDENSFSESLTFCSVRRIPKYSLQQ